MILDTLENSGLYESIHPRFKKAFDYLKNTDLVALPFGKIELEGASLVVNVVEITKTHIRNFHCINLKRGITWYLKQAWFQIENIMHFTAAFTNKMSMSRNNILANKSVENCLIWAT